MHKAIILTEPGGPEKLKWVEVPIPEPGEGEVLIHQKAVGLNFIDVYHRTGLYKLPQYPAVIGMEGAGVIEKAGPGVKYFKVGDRVAYGTSPPGAYTQYRALHERFLVRIPDAMAFELAASIMLKGLTAHYLVRRTYQVGQGHSVLLHAAAGGVGLLVSQWAKHLGARVIGTAGTPEKAALAKAHGCDEVIIYGKEDVAKRVREITNGQGVHVAYDSVGKDTYIASLDSLMPMGLFVSFGQSSGSIPPFDVSMLSQRGSLYMTRPSLTHYTANYEDFVMGCAELFEMVMKGKMKINVGQSYYLSDAASAHRDLEARKTTGATVLVTA